MAETLLEEDAYRDAADCEIGMLKGQLRYIGDNTGGIDYGDDSSEWAFDGECDDPRFAGADMADVLLDEDKFRDATDCRQGMESGRLRFVGSSPGGTFAGGINYGDDSSEWAFDGECDDPRFTGPGMTSTPLLDEDIAADATDCRTAYEAGLLELR